MSEEKETIINGIDVSECGFCCWKHNANELIENYCAIFNNKCICNPDCYFKQLKRLQQENKELKKANNLKNELLADLGCPTVATAKRLQFTLKEQIDRLQQENEELKKIKNEIMKPILLPNIEEEATNKYKSALEEIRNIAETPIIADKNRFDEITNKINEVLNDRD